MSSLKSFVVSNFVQLLVEDLLVLQEQRHLLSRDRFCHPEMQKEFYLRERERQSKCNVSNRLK